MKNQSVSAVNCSMVTHSDPVNSYLRMFCLFIPQIHTAFCCLIMIYDVLQLMRHCMTFILFYFTNYKFGDVYVLKSIKYIHLESRFSEICSFHSNLDSIHRVGWTKHAVSHWRCNNKVINYPSITVFICITFADWCFHL